MPVRDGGNLSIVIGLSQSAGTYEGLGADTIAPVSVVNAISDGRIVGGIAVVDSIGGDSNGGDTKGGLSGSNVLSAVPSLPFCVPAVVLRAHNVDDVSSLLQAAVNESPELLFSLQVGQGLSDHHVVFSLSLGSEDGIITFFVLVSGVLLFLRVAV